MLKLQSTNSDPALTPESVKTDSCQSADSPHKQFVQIPSTQLFQIYFTHLQCINDHYYASPYLFVLGTQNIFNLNP